MSLRPPRTMKDDPMDRFLKSALTPFNLARVGGRCAAEAGLPRRCPHRPEKTEATRGWLYGYDECPGRKQRLVGTAEIASYFNVSRQRVTNWKRHDPTFPKPVAQLAAGPVWRLAPILRWASSTPSGCKLLAGALGIAFNSDVGVT